MLLECLQKGDVIVTEHRVSDHDVLVLSHGSRWDNLPEHIIKLAVSRGAFFAEVRELEPDVEPEPKPVEKKKK